MCENSEPSHIILPEQDPEPRKDLQVDFELGAAGKSTGDGGKQTNKTLKDCVGVTSHLRILSQLGFYRLLIGKHIEAFRNALVPPTAKCSFVV